MSFPHSLAIPILSCHSRVGGNLDTFRRDDKISLLLITKKLSRTHSG
ncbi:hypothetical protein [Candidatus Tisiphia endosymbiont of Hybos culiciformis]